MSKSTHTGGMEMSHADERSYVNMRAVMITVVVLFASLIVGMALMVLYFNILEARAGNAEVAIGPTVDPKALPPEPRLQFSNIHPSTEEQDMGVLHARQDSVLGSYGWVDRPNGIVRMPIDKAMEIVAERGTRQATAATATGGAPAAADTAAAASAPAPAQAPADTAKAAAGH